MKKICTASGTEFEVTDADLKFYEKMGIPAPSLCPDERQRRRGVWRNERKLYRRRCAFTKKNIISMYSADSLFKIFSQKIWWSDQWNALDFGREFDFSRPFFEQFRELQLVVPRLSLVNKNSENCQYTNHASNNKNCYLATVTFDSEDIYYSDWVVEHCTDCMDCSYLFDGSELCYEVYYGWGAYHAYFSQFIKRCRDVWFCTDCIACEYCFLCSNLRNKKYCIKNQQYTREAYEKIMQDILPMTHESLEKFKTLFEDFKKSSLHRASYSLLTEDSTGDHLFNTKNCQQCFDCMGMEDCSYCTDAIEMKDSLDAYHMGWSQLVYDSHAISNGFEVRFCHFSYENKHIDYCDSVHNSHDLFGCVGLNHKQYCILNRQYKKDEYFELRDRIIEHMKSTGEWGEFFPIELSPFAYNQTIAQEYFPLKKEDVLARGWRWHEEDLANFCPATITDFPKSIADIHPKICDEMLACEQCTKNYQIQKPELKLLQKMQLPIPRKCPDCRHAGRVALRSVRRLFDRKCTDCGTRISTTFDPDRPERVVCETCFHRETG